jgi:hypothetical protein
MRLAALTTKRSPMRDALLLGMHEWFSRLNSGKMPGAGGGGGRWGGWGARVAQQEAELGEHAWGGGSQGAELGSGLRAGEALEALLAGVGGPGAGMEVAGSWERLALCSKQACCPADGPKRERRPAPCCRIKSFCRRQCLGPAGRARAQRLAYPGATPPPCRHPPLHTRPRAPPLLRARRAPRPPRPPMKLASSSPRAGAAPRSVTSEPQALNATTDSNASPDSSMPAARAACCCCCAAPAAGSRAGARAPPLAPPPNPFAAALALAALADAVAGWKSLKLVWRCWLAGVPSYSSASLNLRRADWSPRRVAAGRVAERAARAAAR